MADGHAADATTERTDTDRRDSHQYFSTRPDTPDIRRTIPVTIAGQRRSVTVSSGVFSSSRLDPGTAVLLEHAPAPPATGTLLDLGCGWGPITLALGLHSPQARIWSVDVNERALELTAMNARSNNVAHVHAVTPDAVPADLTFDTIWSNPPIRVGKAVLHELLLTWLPRLNSGACAYLVVQKNLGADSLLPWMSTTLGAKFHVSRIASSKGYRIIEVQHTA